ncbi:MAG: hypothetical protein ACP5JG_12695 [Anaerolineae bacterium]
MSDFLYNGLFTPVTVAFQILIIPAQIKSALGEIHEAQEKTNQLLRQYLTDERDDVE